MTRYYNSFSEAALEAGRSRIYGGIHFEFSNTLGLTSGRAIGDLTYANQFEPVPDASTFLLAILSCVAGLAGRVAALKSR